LSAVPRPLGGVFGWAAEGLYHAGTSLRGALYDAGLFKARRLDARVISVGNLTVGGTGKTPVVIELAERLTAKGRKVAILSRGYGRTGGGSLAELPPGMELPENAALLYGDEPCLIHRRLPLVPIVLASDRVRGGRHAIDRYGADLLLLDDGMQHRRIFRDTEVVVIAGKEPIGNGRLLPRGILRETPRSIARADILFVNETEGRRPDLEEFLRRIGAPGAQVRFRYEPRDVTGPDGSSLGSMALRGRNVVALSAIGTPSSFDATLERSGARIAARRPFRDHHRFRGSELSEAASTAKERDAILLTTEKDAARLTPVERQSLGIHVISISFHLLGGGEYLDMLAGDTATGGEDRVYPQE